MIIHTMMMQQTQILQIRKTEDILVATIINHNIYWTMLIVAIFVAVSYKNKLIVSDPAVVKIIGGASII